MRIKLSTFFRAFVLSCISPAYYDEVRRSKIRFSIKYFLVFHVLSALIAVITFAVILSTINTSAIRDNVSAIYPNDLETTLKDGKLTINKPSPYFIPFPESWTSSGIALPGYAAVYMQQTAVKTAGDILTQNAAVALTETELYIPQQNGKLLVIPYPSWINTGTFNQSNFSDFIHGVFNHPFISMKLYAWVVGILLFPVIYIVSVFGAGLVILLYSVPYWIITTIFFGNRKISFVQAVRIGMHTMTPVVVISTIFRFAGHQDIPSFYAFVYFMAWSIICTKAMKPIAQR